VPDRYQPDGICHLRAASMTLRTKVEHTLARCFAAKVVPFETSSLVRPFSLCLSVVYCALVQTSVFFAPTLSMADIDDSVQILARRLPFSTEQAKEVILMVVAFKTFANLDASSSAKIYSTSTRPRYGRTVSRNIRRRQH
jgi:hypothetical protein